MENSRSSSGSYVELLSNFVWPFLARKFSLAILDVVGLRHAVLPGDSSLDWPAAISHHWPIDRPTDPVNQMSETDLVDARLAEVGLKVLKGAYEEALEICEDLFVDCNNEDKPCSVTLKIRVGGLTGLVLALKEDWKAATDFLLGSVRDGLEDCESCDSTFFHNYVLGLFGEVLGFLLTHGAVTETNFSDGSIAFHQPIDCDSSHLSYPILLLGLGIFEESRQNKQNQEKQDEQEIKTLNMGHHQMNLYWDCAKLHSGWSESTCVCFKAYDMAALAATESKNMDDVHKILAESIQLAKSLHMTQLESFLWRKLGGLELKNGNFYLALKCSCNSLQSQLRIGADVEKSEIQLIGKLIMLAPSRAGVDFDVKKWFPGPPPDAHPIDVMVHAFCVVAYLVYDDESLRTPAFQEVAEVVNSNEVKDPAAVWIYDSFSVLLKEYTNSKKHKELARVYLIYSKLVKNLKDRLGMLTFAAKHWYLAGELGKGLEIMREVLDLSAGLDASQCKFRALLNVVAATYFEKDGQTSKATAIRETAWDICTGENYNYSDASGHTMAEGMVKLLFSHFLQNNWPAAHKLVHSVDVHIQKNLRNTKAWEQWQYVKSAIIVRMDENDYSVAAVSEGFVIPKGEESLLMQLRRMEETTHESMRHRKWASVLRATGKMLNLILMLPQSMASWKHVQEGRAHLRRSRCYHALQKEQKRSEELEIALTLFNSVEECGLDTHGLVEEEKQTSWEELVTTLCFYAIVAIKGGSVPTSERLIKLAEHYLQSFPGMSDLSILHYHQACVLEHRERWDEAAVIARKSALLAMDEQRRVSERFGQYEPLDLWLEFYGDQLFRIFWSLQNLYTYCLKKPQVGFLWVERSRLRFMMHQIHNQPSESAIPNPPDIDACDSLLTLVIVHTMKALRPKTAIIEFSYHPSLEILHIYVIKLLPNDDCKIICRVWYLRKWFKDNYPQSSEDLNELIERAIQIDDSNSQIEALTILHSLLVESIEGDLKGYDSLIFSPGHGYLAKVPFAALIDRRNKEHLISSKNVSVIPSIVILHRCLYNQYKFETNLQFPGPLLQRKPILDEPGPSHLHNQSFERDDHLQSNLAFVAGNPVPMGLKMGSLPGAENEAKKVAALFGVKPYVGKEMTKQAVLNGLSSSKVVLLATHGKVDDYLYPHGCLVLQGVPNEADLKGKGIAEEQGFEQRCDIEVENMRNFFDVPGYDIEEDAGVEAPQVLTAGEIVALKGGVSAGLVVLSACQSGLGESTSGEELLGLGRALLQAGAVSTILTLWKVNDRFTCEFVTDLFKELLNVELHGKCVSDCLQTVMLARIRDGHPIRDWAPFSIVGSPTLRLFKPNKSWGVSGLDKYSQYIFLRKQHCLLDSCRVCRNMVMLGEGQPIILHDHVKRLSQFDGRHMDEIDPQRLEEVLRGGGRIIDSTAQEGFYCRGWSEMPGRDPRKDLILIHGP